jgi:hypothetical protein
MNTLSGLLGKTLDSGLGWDKRDDSTVITSSSSATVKHSNVDTKMQSETHASNSRYRTIEDFVRELQGTALLSMTRNDRAFILSIVRLCVNYGGVVGLSDDDIVARFQNAVTNARLPPLDSIAEPAEEEGSRMSSLGSASPNREHAAAEAGRMMKDSIGTFSAGSSSIATIQSGLLLGSDASEGTATAALQAADALSRMEDDDSLSSVQNFNPHPLNQVGQAVSPSRPQLPQNAGGESEVIEGQGENHQSDQQCAAANAAAAQND